MIESCETCKFWSNISSSKKMRIMSTEQMTAFLCRRFPFEAPKLFDEWCGEYKDKYGSIPTSEK
jgi:hypothetical protein